MIVLISCFVVWDFKVFIFLICAASSSNTYTRTFSGIDGAGKRLANEVSSDMHARLCFILYFWACSFVGNDQCVSYIIDALFSQSKGYGSSEKDR